MKPTWDQKNAEAVLRQCQGCGKWWWFTNHARVICLVCEEQV